MADHTHIEWTDATWNPVTGCSVVSPGCTNCYAMKLAGGRLQHHPSRAGLTTDSKAGPVWNGQVRLNAAWLAQPLQWKRPRRIFVCAHGDLFHESVPDAWIDQVFAVMALAPQHTFQVLTKRSARMRDYIRALTLERLMDAVPKGEWPISWHQAAAWLDPAARPQHRAHYHAELVPLPLPNVWLGVSAEDQARAAERIPDLLATPAAIRFLSAEPLLGPIDLRRLDTGRQPWWAEGERLDALTGANQWECDGVTKHNFASYGRLDWVIAGGESGPGARPMHPDWARQIRDDCAAAGVPFFFKQWGEHLGQLDRRVAYPSALLRWVRDDGRVAQVDEVERIERREGDQNWKIIAKIGKRAAGRRLDGAEHNAMPEAR